MLRRIRCLTEAVQRGHRGGATFIGEAGLESSKEQKMPTSIVREEVQRLITGEAGQLVEVLPSEEYQDEHIEGAINIPLKRLNRETTSHLDKTRPLIVY